MRGAAPYTPLRVLLLLSDAAPGILDRVIQFFGEFGYWGPFLLLLACGLGLPLPEEISLIGSGVLLYEGYVEFWPVTTVCMIAILGGDSIPFLLGRRYGLSLLRIGWISKVLHPERFAKFEAKYAKHRNMAVFSCRFVAGLRMPGYFLAGAMGTSYWRFLLLDTIGAVLTVPISIYLGKLLGGERERLQQEVHKVHMLVLYGVIAVLLYLLFRAWRKRRALASAARAEQALQPQVPVLPLRDPSLAEVAAQALEAGQEGVPEARRAAASNESRETR
jgi:membrane protein DedA with SNARE-associated domain